MPIVAVFETHVQADHVSGLPELVARTGATAYLPEGAGVDFEHVALADGEVVELGNTVVQALATPGPRRRASRLRGDRPHARRRAVARAHRRRAARRRRRPARPPRARRAAVEEMARTLYRSLTERLLALPDHVLLYPAHYSGSVCGRGLSANPISTIGFERRHNRALQRRRRGRVRRGAGAGHPAGARAPGRDPRRQPRGRPLAPAGERRRVELGLRENLAQFALLVAVNAFVGAMVGLERSTLPLIGEADFGLASKAAVLSFIVAFGLAKALTNLGAGALAAAARPPAAADRRLGDRAAGPAAGRRRAELGLDRRRQRAARHQPGPRVVHDRGDEDRPRRPEAARLRARAQRGGRLRRRRASPPRLSAAGWPAEFAARDVLVVAGAVIAVVALVRVGAVRARHGRARRARAGAPPRGDDAAAPPLRAAFADATWRVPALRACSQAGLVNNLNDALAWGLVPLFLAAHGASVGADRARRRHLPGGLGRRPDLDRPLVRPRRAQAADRRRHARSRPPRSACSPPRTARSRSPPLAAVAARRRHRARLPDADRRDLRRRLAGRARADGRRLPLLARHGLRRRRPGRRARRRRARAPARSRSSPR